MTIDNLSLEDIFGNNGNLGGYGAFMNIIGLSKLTIQDIIVTGISNTKNGTAEAEGLLIYYKNDAEFELTMTNSGSMKDIFCDSSSSTPNLSEIVNSTLIYLDGVNSAIKFTATNYFI